MSSKLSVEQGEVQSNCTIEECMNFLYRELFGVVDPGSVFAESVKPDDYVRMGFKINGVGWTCLFNLDTPEIEPYAFGLAVTAEDYIPLMRQTIIGELPENEKATEGQRFNSAIVLEAKLFYSFCKFSGMKPIERRSPKANNNWVVMGLKVNVIAETYHDEDTQFVIIGEEKVIEAVYTMIEEFKFISSTLKPPTEEGGR